MLTWQDGTDFLMLYLAKNFTAADRETLCQTEKFVRNSEGRLQMRLVRMHIRLWIKTARL